MQRSSATRDLVFLRDARRFSARHVMDIISTLQKTVNALQRSSAGRLEAELCLIELCAPEVVAGDEAQLAGRIAALETRLASGVFAAPIQSRQKAAPQGTPPQDDDCPFPLEDDVPPPLGDQDAPPEIADTSSPSQAKRDTVTSAKAPSRSEIASESKIAILKALSGVPPPFCLHAFDAGKNVL